MGLFLMVKALVQIYHLECIPRARPRIYSENGIIYADDTERNHTRISPHDPETGEWVILFEKP